MKIRFIVLLFTLFVGVSSLNAQEKSSQPTFQEESLFYAGKIWGFVKYYHPEARTGKFNMDSLLVVLLDKSAETKTSCSLSQKQKNKNKQ